MIRINGPDVSVTTIILVGCPPIHRVGRCCHTARIVIGIGRSRTYATGLVSAFQFSGQEMSHRIVRVVGAVSVRKYIAFIGVKGIKFGFK